MTGGSSARPTQRPTEDEVAAYLRDHPDFLARHPELVVHLTPPRADFGRGVLDFQAFMVERLRDEVTRVQSQQQELISTSRANLNNQNRIHGAILYLLDARSFEHLIETISSDMAVLLDLDIACLAIESDGADAPHAHASGIRVVDPGLVHRLMGDRAVALHADIEGDAALYGPAAGLVRSEVLLRLQIGEDTPPAVLAFGSRDPTMFQPGQGTELVYFLARVVERCIRSWLNLPA